jgi:type II secretory pathway pseudopilin PulG
VIQRRAVRRGRRVTLRLGRGQVGFTIVELLVVIMVIVLILAIAVPGLSAIATQSRFSAATQEINGALTRAYYAALSDVNLTAVRFVPGSWDVDARAEAQRPTGRQHLVTYRYTGTSAADPTALDKVAFGEYFARREGYESLQLPEDVWVAPVEALEPDAGKTMTGTRVLEGKPYTQPGSFYLDPDPDKGNLLNADDFLIIFDPQTGLRRVTAPIALKASIPAGKWDFGTFTKPVEADRWPPTSTDTEDRYRRYNFSGIVLYPREPFLALGVDATGTDRQDWLRVHGRPYLVHRFGGGLVMGAQGSQ